ncbi:MAG TPA: hypothetical protein VMG41_17670 [Gemmatimonadales bacterium]|nr:hypothetical protein [Gemmatimonadales bacterium]
MTASWRRIASLLGLVAVLGASGLAAQAPSVSVSGVIYAQYLYQLNSDSTLLPSGGHQNNFDITRAYLNAIGKFGGGVQARVTTDITRPANSYLAVRLKYAYGAWNPEGSALTYKLGLFTTPWLDWEEALWDYRMQGAMALDRNGYLTSSDYGAGVDGSWGYDRVNMQVGVFDGEGYGGAPGDQRKDIEGRVSVKLVNTDLGGRVGGLRITGYAGYGKPTTGGQRERYIGMLSYKSKAVTLAAEYARMTDSTTGGGAVTAVAHRAGQMISAYGVLNIPDSKVGVIGRVDIFDPNTANNSAATNSDRQTRIIGGLSYQLSSNLRMLADIDHVTFQGGGKTPTSSTAYLQAQVTY